MREESKPSKVVYLIRMAKSYLRHQGPRTAAQISYYLLFSVFPVLMIVVGIIGFLHLDVAATLSVLEDSALGSEVVTEYITYVLTNESPGLMSAGIIMAIIASSAAFRGILRYTGEVSGRQSFRGLLLYGVSFAMSIVLLLVIFLFLVAMVTGKWFIDLLREHFVISVLLQAWNWLRFPVMFALGVLALTAIYRVSLSKKGMPNSKAWPGAVAATISLVIGTGIFSMVITASSKYSLIYGPLTAIIVLLLWFFVCSNILLLGNVMNCMNARHWQEDTTPLYHEQPEP